MTPSVPALRRCGSPPRRHDERGAILVQVALATVVLCGFCGLVIDYGVLWVSRAQAQNVADAAALAGATSLAFDSIVDPSVSEEAALTTATPNHVWGVAPSLTSPASVDSTCVVPGTPPPSGNVYSCVAATVYRNGQQGSTRLPTFFARLFNVMDQGVKAEAKATAAPANTSHCVWPLAIPDKWGPTTGPIRWSASPPSMYIKYTTYPTAAVPSNTYTAPSSSSPGTGYRLSQNTLNVSPNVPSGLTLTQFPPGSFADATPSFGINTNQFVAVSIPGGSFTSTLAACNGLPVHIGQTLALDNSGTIGDATSAAAARVAADLGATWNATTLRVASSCALSASPCALVSPRLVVLPLFDVDLFEETRRSGSPQIHVVNFAGFFINQVNGASSIHGYFSTYPGRIDIAYPQVGYLTAFLRTAALLR